MSAERSKLLQVHDQVDEVQSLMRTNIDKALTRGQALEELEDKSAQLDEHASGFSSKSRALKSKMCCRAWRNMAIMFFIFVVVLVLILWWAGAFD